MGVRGRGAHAESSGSGRARRFETQAQAVVRRLVQLIVVIIGIVAILSTFAAARQAMTTLLASAGLISVIAGPAAQQTLGNVFAGIQLAFTDAIRVGDVSRRQRQGGIGRDRGDHPVLRRRAPVGRAAAHHPLDLFHPRRPRELDAGPRPSSAPSRSNLDWAAPMALIRQKVESLLQATDLWDGRTWNVQMTGSDTSTVTVRILVSAKNSRAACGICAAGLREHIIAWVVAEEPRARPATRIQPQAEVAVPVDTSRAQVRPRR